MVYVIDSGRHKENRYNPQKVTLFCITITVIELGGGDIPFIYIFHKFLSAFAILGSLWGLLFWWLGVFFKRKQFIVR